MQSCFYCKLPATERIVAIDGEISVCKGHLRQVLVIAPLVSAQHCVNADSGDSLPAENLPTTGVSPAQEGGR